MSTRQRISKGLYGLLIIWVLSLAVLAGCGGGSSTTGTTSDTTAPTNTTASNFINSGASSTSSTPVTLAISATDSVGVTGYYASETSTAPSASATGWTSVTSITSYSASVPFTLSSGEGTKTVYVWFKDAAGNASSSVSDSITYSTTTAATDTYLFYQGSLVAVDPANTGTQITVESQSITDARGLIQGTYNSTNLSASDIHNNTIVYAKGGSLYKVSALKSSGTPTPVQLSNETGAATICNTDTGEDLSDPTKSQYVYSLPGTDGQCNTTDDVWKMVRLGMSSTDTPISAKEPILGIANLSTDALTGHLAVDGNNLNRYDTDFANPTLVKAFTAGVNRVGSFSPTGIFLQIDDELYFYTISTGTLSGSLHTFTSTSYYGSQMDGTNLYFIDGASVYKVPQDGSSTATRLVQEGSNIYGITLTTNKVVYLADSSLKAVSKSGGAAATLDDGSSGGVSVFLGVGDRVYYYMVAAWDRIAKVMDENGTNQNTYNHAMWVGSIYPVSATIGQYYAPARIILADGINSSNGSMAGSTLKSYNTADNTLVAALGTIPSDISSFGCWGYGDAVICEGYDSGKSDVFFVNAGTANSLVRLTSTSANEYQVFKGTGHRSQTSSGPRALSFKEEKLW